MKKIATTGEVLLSVVADAFELEYTQPVSSIRVRSQDVAREPERGKRPTGLTRRRKGHAASADGEGDTRNTNTASASPPRGRKSDYVYGDEDEPDKVCVLTFACVFSQMRFLCCSATSSC